MLYIADISDLTCEDLKNKVCSQRIEYADKYKFEIDRRRSLAVEALLNVALRYEGYEGDFPVRVGHEDNWKPYFMDKIAIKGYDKVYFSLSHSGNYVAVAIGDSPIGIDIEEIKGHTSLIEEKYFSDEEKLLMNTDPDGAEAGFFRIWTLKEAFLKAVGAGLKYGIGEVHVMQGENEGIKCDMQIREVIEVNLCEVPIENINNRYSLNEKYYYNCPQYYGMSYDAPEGYALSVALCT